VHRLGAGANLAALVLVSVMVMVGCSDDGGHAAPATTAVPAPALTKSELVIGNVGAYSGTFGPQYQSGADALTAWSQWVNAHGGINGHPVRVVVRNDDGDPAKSTTAVKQLVEDDKVIALVGNNAGATDSSWRSYVEQHRIPVIGGLTLTQSFGTSPMFFPATAGQEGFVASQVDAAKLSGGTKLGTVVCAERAACQQGIPLFESAARAAGLSVAGSETVAGDSSSYTTYCRTLKDAGADVVILNTAGPVIDHFIKDCSKLNYKPKYVFSGDVFQPSLISSATEGSYIVSGGPLWFGDQPNHADFLAALKQYTKVDPNGFASRTWQAGLLFAAAARNVSDQPTAAEILDGLYALQGETLGGWSVPLTYQRGAGNSIGTCDWIAQIKGGKLIAPKGYGPVCT
jgi:branched-chain amino acid transport system substrate-binding protein